MVEYLPRKFYEVNKRLSKQIVWIEFNFMDTIDFPNAPDLDTDHYVYKIDGEMFINNFGERFKSLIDQHRTLVALSK